MVKGWKDIELRQEVEPERLLLELIRLNGHLLSEVGHLDFTDQKEYSEEYSMVPQDDAFTPRKSPIFNDTVMLASIQEGVVATYKGDSKEKRALWFKIKEESEKAFGKDTPFSLKTKNFIGIKITKIDHQAQSFQFTIGSKEHNDTEIYSWLEKFKKLHGKQFYQ